MPVDFHVSKRRQNLNPITGCYEETTGPRNTCRKNANLDYSQLAGKGYIVSGSGRVGSDISFDDSPASEITSGGPGSTGSNCCGLSVGVFNKDGTVYIASEDQKRRGTGQKKVFCADNHDQGAPSCMRIPGGGMVGQPVQGTGKNGLAGQPVKIQWQVEYLPNNGGVRKQQLCRRKLY